MADEENNAKSFMRGAFGAASDKPKQKTQEELDEEERRRQIRRAALIQMQNSQR